jgi:ATP-binding cassette subfamily A (ABC1) protein 3
MASSRQPPQWRRIYRQTITLIHKNLLIFWSAPISTLIRALIFPIVATVIFCELKNIRSSGTDSSDYGIASTSTPVKDLVEAMHDASKSKLVFIRNGISNDTVIPIIDGISKQVGMDSMNVLSSDDANDLYDLCKQTTSGGSDCFAAVLFLSFNETNVEYAIAIDGNVAQQYGYGNYKTGDNNLNNRIFPLQWALEAQIGGFPTNPKPSTQAWAGYFGPNTYDYGSSFSVQSGSGQENVFWLSLVSVFVAPVFILILIGAVYHLATFVATERETSIAELMAAQKVSITPRMLSTFLSFFAVYFPGFLISSILLTQLLFTRTSDILFLFLILLAGASLITSAHFLASFFGKAQLAGLYTSVLTFALALVILAATLTSVNPTAQVLALSLIFPPITWATLIADTALREANLKALSLVPGPFNPNGDRTQFLDGYLYIVFFIVQIIVFSIATYFVEKGLWGVKRTFARIDGGSDVALRCTGLSKTYHAKHPWYWPFMKKGKTVVAVDNLDLEVKKGSVTFLLGPNGGGKTTTLKCVAGMTSMDSGSRLELNEAGLVFGICPQHNVSDLNIFCDISLIYLGILAKSYCSTAY